jgi:hypothetical protein
MNLLSLLFYAAAVAAPTPACGAPQSASGGTVDAGSQIQVQTTGNVTFDLDSDEIFDLHGNGTLRVTERSGSVTRMLFAQGTHVTYTVNGASRPYDDDAKDWLRGVLAQQPAPPPPPGPGPNPPPPPPPPH